MCLELIVSRRHETNQITEHARHLWNVAVKPEISRAALIKSGKMIILSENAVLQEVIELQYFPINNLTKLASFMF